jgi:hypothetical protein
MPQFLYSASLRISCLKHTAAPSKREKKSHGPIIKAIKTANVLSYKSKEFSNAKPYPKDKE